MWRWRASEEFADVTGMTGLQDSLVNLGLCDASHRSCELHENGSWYRGGSETYLQRLTIRHHDQSITRLLLKACVAVSLEMNGTAPIMERWIRRRKVLAAHGVATPTLHFAHRSTLCEEWIPHTIGAALNGGHRAALLRDLGRTTGVLTGLGFPSVRIDDLRSRGDDAVVVDFGWDLGEPGQVSPYNTGTLDQVLRTLESLDPPVRPLEIQILSEGFEVGLGQELE
jgi:hypothetical protein